MRTFIAAIVFVGIFGTAICTIAQMSSTNFEIRWDTVGAGGDETSSSSSYILRDTTGNVGIGDSTSSSYGLRAGYRQGVNDQFIEFSFLAQNQTVYQPATAILGNIITTTTSDFTVGDLIAVIQDRGQGQISAIGTVISVGATTIEADELIDGGSSPAIDGSNDYVYLLDLPSVNLGTLTASAVRTSIIGIEVSTDSDGGYVVQVASDGDLRSGAYTINAVADGVVSAGSEEFGGRSSDTTLAGSTFDSADTAFTTSFQNIMDSSSEAHAVRSFLTLMGSIDGSTVNETYTQELTFVISGTY